MAIALDTSAHAAFVAGASATQAYTPGGAADFLVVSISQFDDAGNISGVTFNGVAMTFQQDNGAGTSGTHERTSMWTLVAPATGAHNVVASFSPNNQFGGDFIISSWSGVHQTVPVGNKNADYNETTLASPYTLALTINADSVAVDHIYRNSTGAMTQGGSQSLIHEGADNGAGERIGASYKAGASSDMTWTWGAGPTRAAISAIELLPAPAGGGGGLIHRVLIAETGIFRLKG